MAYTASKSPTKGRPGFSISFRHPLRADTKGKPGLKVRKGLGTQDAAHADVLVAQMNEILADDSWWNAGRYDHALLKYDRVVVDAFFDGLQAGAPNSARLRDEVIPLPGKDQGYAKVMLVGTTGAGKTSLLRHLIGSDPEKDRFPSTSTAKTTVSDIEVIPSDGPYRAVVTFFSEHVIQANVEDCLLAACGAVWDGLSDAKIADKLLHHADQRFRLSYVLGGWREDAVAEGAEDDWDFGNDTAPAASPVETDREAVSDAERDHLTKVLNEYVSRIKVLASQKAATIKHELLPDAGVAKPEDREAAAEIFLGELQDDEGFRDLLLDILDEIVSRFDRLEAGELARKGKSTAWPTTWVYESADRDDFLRQVRWFSSNYAPSFGRLLTPLVDGIRVQGDLFPTFTDRRARVVYFDGQGLGHTPDSSSSVTTHVTEKFAEVDAILLVDNAEQPIQAAAQSVLRAAAASGNYGKLMIAFTHFDQVKGANLPDFSSKRAHVLASVHNYLARLRDILSGPIVSAMERTIDDQCFMLGGLDGFSKKLPAGVRAQLGHLLDTFERAVAPPPPPDAKPTYDPSGLGFAVQRAADSFQKIWAVRLGFTYSATISNEHWTRIKALNRRIANELGVEYDSLRPVADFIGRVTEEVANFLDNPIAWTRKPVDDDEYQEAIAPIRQSVFNALHGLAMQRIVTEHLIDWRIGLDQKGKGSAARRAVHIRSIYELAAPIPGTVTSEPAAELMREIKKLVRDGVESNGGAWRSE